MSDPREIRGGEHLSSGSPQAAPTGCQPLPVWLEVCAGRMPGEVAMTHLKHAAECRDCSGLLAQANASLGPDPSPEEQSILNRLETSSTAGQQRLAKLMHSQRSKPSKRPASRSSWKLFLPILSWGAAAVCIITIAAILLLRQPSDATLLAEAYNQQRPSQLRLPGTEPGPLASPTRGSAPTPDSSQLLRLKLRTQQSFEQKPNDPSVRQTLGRIALVEHDGETARRNFEMAQALNPNLPGLNFDLASAYFELAESTGQSLNYARAIDLYSKHLQQVHGNDPVALYNRALCWERTAVPHEAIADLQAALTREKDPRWRQEIQSRLDPLRQTSSEPTPRQPLSAAVFLTSPSDPPGYYEQYLSLAGRSWIPRRGAGPQIDAALHKLALLGRAHNDHWIGDMLAQPQSEAAHTADQILAEALTASSTGKNDAALAASARAATLYRHLNNQAGYLRASVEHLYALQRLGLNDQCLREAAALSSDIQLKRYSWLRSYLQLEISGAHAMLGDWTLASAESSLIAANTYNVLPVTSLRARSFAANAGVRLQHYTSAWTDAAAGLHDAARIEGSSMARFQLLSALIAITRALNLQWTQTGLAEAAVNAATKTSNRQTAAYATEELALDDLQVGEAGSASRNFQAADNLLASLGRGPGSQLYAADWNTDRVLLIAQDNGPLAALQTLQREEPLFQKLDAALPRLHYYTEYAELLDQLRDTNGSLAKTLVAVNDAERYLGESHTTPDHEGRPTEFQNAYEILVWNLSRDSTNPRLALRAWEWLRSARYREGRPFATPISADELNTVLPGSFAPRSGDLYIAISKVFDHYIAWSVAGVSPSVVHQHLLNASADSIVSRGSTLLRLCSDPHSSSNDIAILGRSLFNDLLAPFQDQIAGAHRIDLDLDSSLGNLPFAALQDHQGFLGLQHPLSFLTPGWSASVDPHEPDSQDRLPHRASLVILEQLPNSSLALIPSTYDESDAIVQLFPDAQRRFAILTRNGSELALSGPRDLAALLSRASLIHYIGHGLDVTAASAAAGRRSTTVFDLSTGRLPHCILAVLAACQTVREREQSAEDVPSFANIILAAGASHVLATGWDVDSRVTSKLMQQFYTALARGDTFADALQQAQQSIESHRASSHPYFWSGFLLIHN